MLKNINKKIMSKKRKKVAVKYIYIKFNISKGNKTFIFRLKFLLL